MWYQNDWASCVAIYWVGELLLFIVSVVTEFCSVAVLAFVSFSLPYSKDSRKLLESSFIFTIGVCIGWCRPPPVHLSSVSLASLTGLGLLVFFPICL